MGGPPRTVPTDLPMKACAIVSDLMFTARILDAADRARIDLRLIAEPAALPPADETHLLLVDWNERRPDWAAALRDWRASGRARAPRLILFGSHTDVAAHREAKSHGIGPVMARSAFVGKLPELLAAP